MKRLNKLKDFSEKTDFNQAIYNDRKIGVITSGICFFYAKEVFGENASYLKLGYTNPLPKDLVKEFANKVETLYIIEENDPYIEEFVRGCGFDCKGKDIFPTYGEMTPEVIRAALGDEAKTIDYDKTMVIGRAPTLCAGCPHRGLFFRLGKKENVMISGDIGCYTLAAGRPYNAMNSCVCMGASLSIGHGAQTVFNRGNEGKRVVAVLGDSTFFHTGINSLINTVYNKSNTVNIILDNRITGMTGHQQNPGTGFTAQGETTVAINIEKVVEAIGIRHIKVIDPNDLRAVDEALDEYLLLDEPSVIITRWPCALKKFSQADKDEFENLFTQKSKVDQSKCIGCKLCQKTGCPSLIFDDTKKKIIIDSTCVGCSVCSQVCPTKAIELV